MERPTLASRGTRDGDVLAREYTDALELERGIRVFSTGRLSYEINVSRAPEVVVVTLSGVMESPDQASSVIASFEACAESGTRPDVVIDMKRLSHLEKVAADRAVAHYLGAEFRLLRFARTVCVIYPRAEQPRQMLLAVKLLLALNRPFARHNDYWRFKDEVLSFPIAFVEGNRDVDSFRRASRA